MKTLYMNMFQLAAGKGYPISLTDQPGEALAAKDFLPEGLTYPASGTNPAGTLDVKAIVATIRNTRDVSPDFEDIGRALLLFLLQSLPGRDWLALVRVQPAAGQPEETVRTVLNILDPDLRTLPWELMRDNGGTLFADAAKPIIHRSTGTGAIRSRPEKWPLRVLVVVGSAPNDTIEAEKEVEGIEKALLQWGQLVEWIVLRQPSLETFRLHFTTKFRPHVLHFIGHGSDRLPRLRFSRPNENDVFLERGTIEILVKQWTPRLVFLNACRSADNSAERQDTTLCDAFAIRVPAVIAMRGSIRGEMAANFSAAFYQAFGLEKTVDVAMEMGRQAIADRTDLVDWCLPRLSLGVLPEEVLLMEPRLVDEERIKVRSLTEFKRLPRFVDRVAERHQLCFGINPIDADANYRDLTTIIGGADVGKSELLHYVLAGCKLRKWKVAYATMGDDTKRSFLDTLRLIRGDESTKSGLAKPTLNPAYFNTFHHQLNNLEAFARNRLPPLPPDELIKETDPAAQIPPELREQVAPGLAESFAQALIAAAEGKPLVVALDQVDLEWTEFTRYLLPHFLKRVAEHQWSPLRVLLVLRTEKEMEYNNAKAEFKLSDADGKPVRVDAFRPEEYEELAKAYFRRVRQLDDNVCKFIEGYAGILREMNRRWTPEEGFLPINNLFPG